MLYVVSNKLAQRYRPNDVNRESKTTKCVNEKRGVNPFSVKNHGLLKTLLENIA